jgi:membrane-associated protease RseP (regulator of RpoE activity)
VRVVNINKLNLNRFVFDYDLTMAFVVAHPDGTVYHRYGGRTSVSPMHMTQLVRIMEQGVRSHEAYLADPQPPPDEGPLLAEQLVNERVQGRMQPVHGCIHCHYVKEARNYLDLETGSWTPDRFWAWPLPKRIGLVMEQEKQHVVKEVVADSPAARAGILSGDVLQLLEGKRIMSKYDVQAVLQESKDEAVFLSFQLSRDGDVQEGLLHLEPAWKTGDPADYAWRSRNVFTQHMIKFLPAPGFIGDTLSPEELHAMGVVDRSFGLRIAKLNYGTFLAGIRQGDLVLGAGGKSNFRSVREFHHWCELLRRSGRDIRLELFRDARPMNVMVSQAYLNYSKVEAAPAVDIGFIPQELPRDAGIRVGHVTDDSHAEQAGLKIGDRIVTMDGRRAKTYLEFQRLLSKKTPGNLLTMRVLRDNQPLQVGFVLAGEIEQKATVARLSEVPIEPGQTVRCIVTLDLPEDKYVYSAHKKSMGLPTELEFRGTGFELVGPVIEPISRKVEAAGLEPSWVLDGKVEFEQAIRITDLSRFQIVLRVYAQVCDADSCHEFRTLISSTPGQADFVDYRGTYEQEAVVNHR